MKRFITVIWYDLRGLQHRVLSSQKINFLIISLATFTIILLPPIITDLVLQSTLTWRLFGALLISIIGIFLSFIMGALFAMYAQKIWR